MAFVSGANPFYDGASGICCIPYQAFDFIPPVEGRDMLERGEDFVGGLGRKTTWGFTVEVDIPVYR